ncbi:uncharacterized protein LOC110975792 [Acanthaster planci]|uniref:Uncharacterized protein LOC110975792 n=1 Tax=Acanthaster planci TaxID=133434 RepID=A0A8B7XWS6_ACAPL|nr:uncharacterized protein LOC110975792 [Acanthaster planci]
MTRWIVALVLCACVAVTLADKTPSTASCEALAAQISTEGKKRWDGPSHTFCGEDLNERRNAYCNCQVVPRKRELDLSEFLPSGKANAFLSGRRITKRSLSEECCHEGCYWEEIEEVC